MRKTAAFVLAGGKVIELGVLTLRRAKAAVPFAGHYRIIDFCMSNLALSGVDRVGVLSQYRPSSLMDHVGNGEAWGLIGRDREAKILPPFQAESHVEWYKGTADAVYQNLNFLKDAEYVLIVSGDHIYHANYSEMFEYHIDRKADLTMAFKRFPVHVCRGFGVAEVKPNGRVVNYVEKPKSPPSNLGSLTIYLFNRQALEDFLRKTKKEQKWHLYADVIPEMVRSARVYAWIFEAYWAYARSIDQYVKASADVLEPEKSGLELDSWVVSTNMEQSGLGDAPPAYIGPKAHVVGSRTGAGCQIEGTVINSILSPDVVIERGSVVVDSVLMHKVHIEKGCKITKVIADKHVVVGHDSIVGTAQTCAPNQKAPAHHTCGATVIGRDSILPPKSKIGGNCQIVGGRRFDKPLQLSDGTWFENGGEEPWTRYW